MRGFGYLILVGVVGLVSPAVADAIKVKAGSTAPVAYTTLLNRETCQYGPPPPAVIVTPPAHGRAEVRKVETKIEPGKPCAGTLIKGNAVFYTPAPGFRGQDQLTVEYTWELYVNSPGTGGQRTTVLVEVQ